jgi:hypothetical protein
MILIYYSDLHYTYIFMPTISKPGSPENKTTNTNKDTVTETESGGKEQNIQWKTNRTKIAKRTNQQRKKVSARKKVPDDQHMASDRHTYKKFMRKLKRTQIRRRARPGTFALPPAVNFKKVDKI